MARSLKRRARANEGAFKNAASAAAVVTAGSTSKGSTIPQIQEMQNIMDAEKSKMDNMRASYALQNCQLAKANSSLMMKLSDLEKSLSELVQENVALRSRISMSELDYRERLNKQLHVLEDGISHRFEEIFHMFDSIRRKEQLASAPNSGHSTGIRSILGKRGENRRSSSYEPRLSHHIQFLDAEDSEAKKRQSITDDHTEVSEETPEEERQKKKRRKSSRRDSIFLSTDFDFYDGAEGEQEGREEIDEDPSPEIRHPNPTSDEPQPASEGALQQQDDPDVLPGDGSFNFTNSIIEYSIPEETAGSITNNDVDPPSSSKIEVFRDDQEAILPKLLLPYDDVNNIDNNNENLKDNTNSNKVTFIPVLTQNKVKHSMRPPNARPGKKIVDEVMPMVGSGDIDFSRSRRTRGKAINYALPSLRAKMRRPTEKLVDATTITSIHDLQVKKLSKRFHRDKTVDNSDFQEPQNETTSKHTEEHHEPLISGSCATSMEKDCENTLEKENIISRKANNIIKTAMKPILRDITNKPNPQAFKTKKLYKNPIINDSDQEDSISGESTRPLSNNSTRSHEEDLSVFDLIGSNNIKQAHKTYRAKAKSVQISKQNKPFIHSRGP